jgi:hypothetical protein
MKIISDINPNKHVQGNIHFSEDFYIFNIFTNNYNIFKISFDTNLTKYHLINGFKLKEKIT